MFKFLLKRITYGFFVLIGVVVVVFLIFKVIPGNSVSMMVGQNSTKEEREILTKLKGLDRPIYEQLGWYMNDLSPLSIHKDMEGLGTEGKLEFKAEEYKWVELFRLGERHAVVLKWPYFGRSNITDRLVLDIILEKIGPTFWLAVCAVIFAAIVGITMGVISALNQNTFLDRAMVTMSALGISTPSFVAAILLAFFFGHYLSEYTGLTNVGSLWENHGDGRTLMLKNLILPSITLGLRPLAIIVQLTRSSMLDVLGQDYIRTARAKGLSKFSVNFKHALKNALNPVVTSITGFFASLMAGSIIVERIFSWNGIGSELIDAVSNVDAPRVMGITLFIAAMFIIVNIMVDILYRIIDPKVSLS